MDSSRPRKYSVNKWAHRKYSLIVDFLSRLTPFNLGAESISVMFEKRPVHVTLMTIVQFRIRHDR